MEKGLCLDTMGTTAGNKFQAIPCHHQGGNQVRRTRDKWFFISKLSQEGGGLYKQPRWQLTQKYCENIRFCKWCKDTDFLSTLSTQEWKTPLTLRYINIMLNYVKIYFRDLFKKTFVNKIMTFKVNINPVIIPQKIAPTKYTWQYIVKIAWLCTEICFVWGCVLWVYSFVYLFCFGFARGLLSIFLG